jgi:hypothetical protein
MNFVFELLNFVVLADSNCIEMVKQGISKKLLGLLSENNTDKGDIKLQHALLSALRLAWRDFTILVSYHATF